MKNTLVHKNLLLGLAPIIRLLEKKQFTGAADLYQKTIPTEKLFDDQGLGTDTTNFLFLLQSCINQDGSTEIKEVVENYVKLGRKHLSKKERLSIFG